MKKRAIVLGATGSIGRNTLDVLTNLQAEWTVVGLAAGSRSSELAELANRFRPEGVALTNGGSLQDLRAVLGYSPRVATGRDALVELVDQTECDCVICAVVGHGGLAATVRAVELGRRVALANKEAMVVAGALLIPLAAKSGAELIPVDSEHSAVFQAMHAGRRADVRRVYLTASGGPFRTWSTEQMERATAVDALRHPTWSMGPKITIDSATMMNKALEIVEARWFFGLSHEQIEVLVHPESIVHSLVEFCDGSVIAQLGAPDMRTPIQYALTYPERRRAPAPTLSLASLGQLRFEEPDVERFPALRLGAEVAERGGSCGAVLNGANEAAVELFRAGRIGFCDITRLTEQALRRHDMNPEPGLADLDEADLWAREEVARCLSC